MGLLTKIKQKLKHIIKKEKRPKLDPKEIDRVKKKNRSSLKEIQKWVNDDDFEKSFFSYGVPDYVKPLLNREIGDEITYTDLLLYYSRYLNSPKYLELGVSVGKNFYQIAEGLENSFLMGFDIEDMSSPLKHTFSFVETEKWKGPKTSLRNREFELTSYNYKSNKIKYLAGDIWDEASWMKLSENKFNIIFSDALHTPEALLWEYQMLYKYQLLDEKFIIIWDDLNNGLENSFHQIAKNLINDKKVDQKKGVFLLKVNGWLGENETPHDIGLITNII
ncbi:hypothetical protein [Pedobacter sp. UBA5917]|jgi:hypothetical protein|uniref:hypothetical protein n=1 Tax=Pedobacter sp. UBA5917 TaxID=1947061 RepID=UPI0025E9EF8D|nr:hypothetical protein [Pedobacter sp. UBA5917]